MKIGILGCFYNCSENIDAVLAPWVELKQDKNIVIAAVSAKFKEYKELEINNDNRETILKLNKLFDEKDINYLDTPPEPLMESQARTLALDKLLNENCDIIWLLDGDEFYTKEEITKILNYINREDNQIYGWFAINFKNYIFDGRQWVDGFAPPRIFRRVYGRSQLETCYWDNDFTYRVILNGQETSKINYRDITNQVIPRSLAHVRHMTWLHSNGKQKVEYQKKHFGGLCSYQWNEETQELELNKDFYLKTGQPLPIINQD